MGQCKTTRAARHILQSRQEPTNSQTNEGRIAQSSLRSSAAQRGDSPSTPPAARVAGRSTEPTAFRQRPRIPLPGRDALAALSSRRDQPTFPFPPEINHQKGRRATPTPLVPCAASARLIGSIGHSEEAGRLVAAPLGGQSCFSSSAGPPSFLPRMAMPSAIRSTS